MTDETDAPRCAEKRRLLARRVSLAAAIAIGVVGIATVNGHPHHAAFPNASATRALLRQLRRCVPG